MHAQRLNHGSAHLVKQRRYEHTPLRHICRRRRRRTSGPDAAEGAAHEQPHSTGDMAGLRALGLLYTKASVYAAAWLLAYRLVQRVSTAATMNLREHRNYILLTWAGRGCIALCGKKCQTPGLGQDCAWGSSASVLFATISRACRNVSRRGHVAQVRHSLAQQLDV